MADFSLSAKIEYKNCIIPIITNTFGVINLSHLG